MDTFGTPLHHLKSDAALVVLVLTLLAYGCPTQAIVHAYNLDERTVGDWLWRAGQHGKAVQEHSCVRKGWTSVRCRQMNCACGSEADTSGWPPS